ncbi:hypothetical protein [Blastopirellula marina]|uniref:Uncharacterized protein n=1 Tax=Blastopirellula marina TaxID=124 RepID=A0A2S8GMF0_9BACT|nr:hypothetical protein [Blastopirellula marina]PQO45521.1 hypothetical protein C5Y93_13820 [Blastopirellula marina]
MRFLMDLYRRWTTPPVVPPEIVEQLPKYVYDPERYLRTVRPRDFPSYLESWQETAALYDRWEPQLRKFATQARLQNIPPLQDTLSERDLAKVSIIESMIARTETPPRVFRHQVVFCVVPLIALPVANQLWPGSDDRCVLLTSEEMGRWDSIWQHPEEAFPWFCRFDWDVYDPPSQYWFHEYDLTTPEGSEPWLIHYFSWFGSLCAEGKEDLWSWDGKQAAFLRSIEHWDA